MSTVYNCLHYPKMNEVSACRISHAAFGLLRLSYARIKSQDLLKCGWKRWLLSLLNLPSGRFTWPVWQRTMAASSWCFPVDWCGCPASQWTHQRYPKITCRYGRLPVGMARPSVFNGVRPWAVNVQMVNIPALRWSTHGFGSKWLTHGFIMVFIMVS